MTRKRIFSGAQPTGELHIGNYLGALKNWVALQDEYEAFYCIVNLHAITLPQDPVSLRQKTLDLARIYIAAGVDPTRSTIFIQSDVPAHAELTWVLSCIARMGELERMTQFKDKTQKSSFQAHGVDLSNVNPNDLDAAMNEVRMHSERQASKSRERAGVGLFTYPVLMAADILLYQTDLVPVGQDQKQHLELSRDLAERFNRDFGETFKVPEPYIPRSGASIKSLQDPAKKMSKSDENPGGAIFLTDDADAIAKKFKRAVTDSGTDIKFDESRPAINNLLTIYQLMTGKSKEDCEANFEGKGYGQLKGELADATIEFMRPFQERLNAVSDEDLRSILNKGAETAGSIASNTLSDVYTKVGIN